jgi:membrane associated rhomboid family serine protease
MSRPQKLGVGLFYAAIAVLGAVCAIFENHRDNWLGHSIKEVMPAFLILVLVFVVYALFRMLVSVLKRLNGVARAAHATLHADYRKK